MSGEAPARSEAVAADAPRAVLEPWIAARLHPLSAEASPERRVEADHRPFQPPEGGVYAPAAVLMGLVERPGGFNVILTRRADTLRRHSGQIALPGGRADPGESLRDAAVREAEEEIGLERRFVHPVGLGDVLRTHTGFEVTPVVAFVEAGFTLTPAEAEVAEVFETPFAFLMDPANHEERVWEAPEGSRTYYAMVHGERMIWGVTAAILRSLWARLFQPGEAGGEAPAPAGLSPRGPPRAAAGR